MIVSTTVQGLVAGLVVVTLPTPAAAQTCSALSGSSSQTYTGTALSATVNRNISCSGFTAGTYYLCTNGSTITGSGGTTITPYRQLDDGSGNKANWQLYNNSGVAFDAAGVVAGTATGLQLNNGTYSVSVEARFPVQSVGYGSYTSTMTNFRFNIKTASDCSGTNVTTADYPFVYTVSVPASCSSVTANTLAFGSISDLTVTTLGQGSVSVTCTSNSPYTVYMGQGSNYDVTNTTNRMKNGVSNYLTYKLYTNNIRTNLWTTTNGMAGTGNGSAQTLQVYGKIPANQTTAAVGSYSDTVVVTVTY